ncbi:MAG: hypothetical protein KCHDKBKB_01282 [Elusimicrobia bacterium]|nr:hypothetical protein [Elusimicrobiota bacterium]
MVFVTVKFLLRYIVPVYSGVTDSAATVPWNEASTVDTCTLLPSNTTVCVLLGASATPGPPEKSAQFPGVDQSLGDGATQ